MTSTRTVPLEARGWRGVVAVVATLAPLMAFAGASKVEPILPTRTFSVGEGLPSALVHQLAQDSTGRIWILNRESVVSFDGESFEPQGVQQGLLATQSAGLTIDDKGRALVAAYDGRVFRREGSTWKALAPAIDPPFAGQVLSLAQAVQEGREKFVVATTEGVWLRDRNAWRILDRAEDRRHGIGTSLSRFGDDLFVGSSAGLCRLRETLDCSWSDDPRLREPVRALNVGFLEGRPALLVLAQRWLGAIVDGRLRLFGKPFDVDLPFDFDQREPRSAAAAINIDPAGAVFFGTLYHGYMLEPGAAKALDLGPIQGRPGEGGLTSILADREGAIWIGSFRGLTRIGSRRFRSLDVRSGLAESEVTAVAELPGGRFVLGHNAGLTFLDENGARVVDSFEIPALAEGFARGIPPRVLDIAVDPSGTAWAAAGTALLEIGPDRHVTPHRLPDRAVAAKVDGRGRLFVLCSHGLYVRRGGRFESLPADFLKDAAARGGRWLMRSGDRLFVATSAGLFWRAGMEAAELESNATWHSAESSDRRGDNVYSLDLIPGGEALVGTSGGLYRLAGEKLEPVTGPRALGRPIYFLLRDRKGQLWAGTDDGVFIAEAEGYRQLSVRHGLAGRETNRGAGLVDSLGQVWIGTDQGLSVYREALDVPPKTPPAVEIEGVDVEGDHRPGDARIELSASPRSVVFRAHIISFASEDQLVCRYRLDGLNEDWQGPAPLTTAGVRYTHLPPGRFQLRIAAARTVNGPWGPESRSQEIFIPTPVGQRPSVWIASLLLLTVALVSGHRLRLRGLAARNLQLESFNQQLRESVTERQRLISELEAKNGELERFTYTVSHDLKAPLVTIRGFASLVEQDVGQGRIEQLKADIQRIHKAADTMGVLLNQLLDLSRIGRVVGPAENLPLGPLILEAAQRVPGIGSAQLVVAADLPDISGDKTRLIEVFENLLANAVKFLGAQAAPRIEVSVREAEPPVIVVSDNGVGIDPRFHAKIFDLFERLDKKVPGTGIGLAIVKRIVEFHGGRIWVESSGVEGEGSRFCLTLPRAKSG